MTKFKYSLDPTALGIDISPDAEFKWCLNRAATRSPRSSQREFAASLLRQWGRWSVKQRKYALSIYIARRPEFNICLTEECRNKSVKRFIAEVGLDAALAHADHLRNEANAMLDDVSQGTEYADSYDRFSDRHWQMLRNAAAMKTEMADRITRISAGVRA